MPPVSRAQRAWAWSHRNAPGAEGRAASDPGGKLPARVKDGKALKGAGLINRGKPG